VLEGKIYYASNNFLMKKNPLNNSWYFVWLKKVFNGEDLSSYVKLPNKYYVGENKRGAIEKKSFTKPSLCRFHTILILKYDIEIWW
jgi:hypothetical protein